MTGGTARVTAADVASLTGVRSGKNSYYREFRRSSERLAGAVSSLDQISDALVRTVEGPRALLTAVVQAAAQHLQARWMVLAVADGCLSEARPRFLGVDAQGVLADRRDQLPAEARPWLDRVRTAPPGEAITAAAGVVVVPMTIDSVPVGGIAGRAGSAELADPMDLSVLRILVNQAAVALHTTSLYHSSLALRSRADQLTQEASQHARDLAVRNEELHSAQRMLMAAREREALDTERHRIARELHDSVTQYVLSAGMVIEAARTELGRPGTVPADLADRLAAARDLTQHAVGQLRAAIYSLNHVKGEDPPALPRLLEQACALHARRELTVDLRLEGSPVALSPAAEQSLAHLVGEALFNVGEHSGARRCVVRLSYGVDQIRLSVDDDGRGDPATLRTLLRVEKAGDVDGRHRGLANMASRAEELGGTFAVRRSRMGGVRTLVRVPVAPRGGELR